MADLLVIIGVALLPAVGTAGGALLAEVYDPPRWLLGALLHAAAGIALAVAAVTLAPRSLATAPVWSASLAFLAGAGISVALVRLTRMARQWASPSKGRDDGPNAGAIMIYAAIGADLFSDGMMTGAGSASATQVGLLLAASQVVGNFPAGFAAAANLRDSGGGRALRLWLAVAAAAPAVLAAVAAYTLLRGRSEELQAVSLAAVTGLLLTTTVEDLIPEADAPEARRLVSSIAFALGFTAFLVIARMA